MTTDRTPDDFPTTALVVLDSGVMLALLPPGIDGRAAIEMTIRAQAGDFTNLPTLHGTANLRGPQPAEVTTKDAAEWMRRLRLPVHDLRKPAKVATPSPADAGAR